MNSERFSVQSSIGANYLNIQLDGDTGLDEMSIRVINNDCPDFLIPFRIANINDRITLKYKLVSAIALKYVDLRMTKKELIKLYLNLIIPFVKGKDWFLDYHNICVDMQYIFLERRNTFQVFYIYVPENSFRNTDEEILGFFKEVLQRSNVTDDGNFQLLLYRYFNEGNVTLQGLYNIIKEEAGRNGMNQTESGRALNDAPVGYAERQNILQNSTNAAAPVQNAGNKENAVKDSKPAKESHTGNANQEQFGIFGSQVNDKAVSAIFGDEKKRKKKEKPVKEKKQGGFLGGGKRKKDKDDFLNQLSEDSGQKNSQMPQQGFINNPAQGELMGYGGTGYNGGESDVTEMYVEGETVTSARLELQSSAIPGAPQRILLDFDKPNITVGRISSDEIKPDIAFPPEFKRIGRSHAMIEKRNTDYYIIDLGSANHTLLNGQRLVPNQPYLMQEGSELCFTDSAPVKYRFYK